MISSDFAKFKKHLGEQAFNNIYPLLGQSRWQRRSKCQKPTKPRDQDIPKTTTFKGKPFDGTRENVIHSLDGRKQVHTTDRWPYSVHGAIEGRFGKETFRGTGTLIGPNVVLTAGHNLFCSEERVYADLESMRFLPGANGQFLPYGKIKVEKYFVPDDFVNGDKEDFGIMILEEPVGEVTGYFGLACLKSAELYERRIYIAGYPEDKAETFQMWGMEGIIDEVDEDQGFISHKIDTSKGQSGSGVVYEEDGKYFVCGVHIQGGKNANIATLITRSRYECISQWIKEHMETYHPLPYLRNCETLAFKNQKINGECLSLLLQENLESLVSLEFRENTIHADGDISCEQPTIWSNLAKLSFRSNKIDDDGAKAIAKNALQAHNLSQLIFFENNMSANGIKAFMQNTNLRHLGLDSNEIDDHAAELLARNTSWVHLTSLDLSRNNIGDEGAKALGQNTSWKKLSQLNLSNNNIRVEGAKGLARNRSWVNLSHLHLSNWVNFFRCKNKSWIWNQIGDEGAKALANNSSWRKLTELDLGFNGIGDEGAKALAGNTSWVRLSELSLYGNNITDKGAKALIEVNLHFLNLSWNNISYEGAHTLPKQVCSSSELNSGQINTLIQFKGNSQVTGSEITSVWKTMKDLKELQTHKFLFSTYYRSFLLQVAPPKEFENFIINIAHFMHSRFDFNNSLAKATEERDDGLREEFPFSFTSTRPGFGSKKLLSIEESQTPKEENSDGNLNSYFSAEERQIASKHAFTDSS